MPLSVKRLTGLAVVAAVAMSAVAAHAESPDPARPNVLWITCEDISPDLGCYGDATPGRPSSTGWPPRAFAIPTPTRSPACARPTARA